MQVGVKGRVYSFEPHPGTRKELAKVLALNELENVTVVPCALSSKTGAVTLYYVGNHKLSSLAPVKDTNYGENKTMISEVDTIDHYCTQQQIDHIDFLKIDVEGFEYDVLLGAQRMLQNHAIKTVQFEMWEKNQHIINLLLRYGYEMDYSRTSSSNYYASVKI